MKQQDSVIVIGAGIAGLTAAAILAHEGLIVTLLEAHSQTGGCAGTFRRGQYIFDVGATQVAGFERGGIHERLFRYLNHPIPSASILDPGCLVDLCDGTDPIRLWHDPEKWVEERNRQFPGSENFWKLCDLLHKSNWSIASRDPILPIRSSWDFRQLIKAIHLENLPTGLFSWLSVSDLMRLCGCYKDQRLKTFLDLQLKLYSQNNADKTAALYGATVLQMAQDPLGLWHLDGSMQKLSDYLSASFIRDGGKLLLNHRVLRLNSLEKNNRFGIEVIDKNNQMQKFESSDVVFTPPPQALVDLIEVNLGMPKKYKKKLQNLPKGNGAIVFYGVVKRNKRLVDLPSHIQLNSLELGSIFISISLDGDGRAPLGKATLIASIFVDFEDWNYLEINEYKAKKENILLVIRKELENYFDLFKDDWCHQELSTPKSFMRWTGRPNGIVGGLGQNPFNFGLLGLPSRTPIRGLWLCGDSIYPGEGTAGVSQSALMACKQLIASRGGSEFNLPS